MELYPRPCMANDVLKSEYLRIPTETLLRLGSQTFPHGCGAHGAQKSPQQGGLTIVQ